VTAGSSESNPLAGRGILLVASGSPRTGMNAVRALALQLERIAGRVAILPGGNVIADLLGRRVLGRPDLVVALLPGRGASLAAVRVAERLGAPLLALVTSNDAPCWGETGTLRRATRVVVTSERLRARVVAAGVPATRIELWRPLSPTALSSFEQIAGRALRADSASSAMTA